MNVLKEAWHTQSCTKCMLVTCIGPYSLKRIRSSSYKVLAAVSQFLDCEGMVVILTWVWRSQKLHCKSLSAHLNSNYMTMEFWRVCLIFPSCASSWETTVRLWNILNKCLRWVHLYDYLSLETMLGQLQLGLSWNILQLIDHVTLY